MTSKLHQGLAPAAMPASCAMQHLRIRPLATPVWQKSMDSNQCTVWPQVLPAAAEGQKGAARSDPVQQAHVGGGH